MMPQPQVKLLLDVACETGENPLWHPQENCLYWTDIPGRKLYRYRPESSDYEAFAMDLPVGGFTLEADGALLLFMARGRIIRWRDGTQLDVVVEEIAAELQTRFNDVIADPAGRVFAGTMSAPNRPGRLYRLDCNGALTVVAENIGTSNGMGFTADRQQMYHTDTGAQSIYLYDYDQHSGAIRNRQVFAQAPQGEGRPDGLTVDSEQCVWSARWDGYRIVRYDADGRELMQLSLPVANVSCLTFGGADYTDIFITTAGGHNRKPGALDGALFHASSQVRGVAEFRSRLGG